MLLGSRVLVGRSECCEADGFGDLDVGMDGGSRFRVIFILVCFTSFQIQTLMNSLVTCE